MSSSQGCLVFQHIGNSSGSTSTRRRLGMVGDNVNIPLFQGNGPEHPRQYWFLCEALWKMKQVQYEDIKKGQLTMTFWGRALDWYMKFVKVLMQNSWKTLEKIRIGLNNEIKKQKS